MPKKNRFIVSTYLSHETIERRIYLIRQKKVMLDRDLAALYGVSTSYLNRQVKRHRDRFPEDFMFQLNEQEFKSLLCQIGTANRGGSRLKPHVFTEHGILMLSSVLNSPRAAQVNIQIMRTFTKIRDMISTHKTLQKKIDEMEKKYDSQFKSVFDAIREILSSDKGKKKPIGFHVKY